MILDNDSMGHIINNIFEYIEGDTINLEYAETPLYSELREVCSLWNKLIQEKWEHQHIIRKILEEQIYQLECVLECGGCSACMCFLHGTSGGENQMAHYGGCFPEEYQTEEEHQEEKNNLSIGGVKYIDYDRLKRKREEDKQNYQDKRFKLQPSMDHNVGYVDIFDVLKI